MVWVWVNNRKNVTQGVLYKLRNVTRGEGSEWFCYDLYIFAWNLHGFVLREGRGKSKTLENQATKCMEGPKLNSKWTENNFPHFYILMQSCRLNVKNLSQLFKADEKVFHWGSVHKVRNGKRGKGSMVSSLIIWNLQDFVLQTGRGRSKISKNCVT